MEEEVKSCGLFLLSPRWKAPCLHISIDGGGWETLPMAHYSTNLFSTEVDQFFTEIRFVFCEEDKSKWLNPSVELSTPETYLRDGKNLNFRLGRSGHFIVLDGHLQQVQTVELQQNRLLAINVDGILCGQQISLINFKTALLKHFYFNGRVKLAFLTGRTFDSLFKHAELLLPDYVIAQAGSKLYRLRPQVSNQNLHQQYDLVESSDITQESHEQARKTLQQLAGVVPQYQPGRISFIIGAHMLHLWKPQLKNVEHQLKQAGLQVNFVSHGTTTFVDITNCGANKASGLKKVMELEQGRQVVGFGSGCNDLQFLKLCSRAIVPCNTDNLTRQVLNRLPKVDLSKCAYADCIMQYLQQLAGKQLDN